MTTPSAFPQPSPDLPGVRPCDVTVGIVTALPVEEHAMEGLVEDRRRHRDPHDRNAYWVGEVPSTEPDRPHQVALVMMPRDGTQTAATCCANMLRTFPNIRAVIMTGIAGGIPRPDQAGKHVRLGDVVVAVDGIVTYGSVRQEGEATRLRKPQGTGLVSSWFLNAARELQVMEQKDERPWERWLDPTVSATARSFARPPDSTDVLYVRTSPTIHPTRPNPGPRVGMPRVHYGVIGSSDALMLDEDVRDRLAQEHPDLRAIEMEGAGIAEATAAFDRTWFMVRGVADYSVGTGRTDAWQPYASYVAAAYVRTLLETTPSVDLGRRPLTATPRPLVGEEDQRRLDVLLRRVPDDVDVQRVWQDTVPDLWDVGPEVTSGPSVAYHFLARQNADARGLHPAILFIAHLSRRLQDVVPELADALRLWVNAHTDAVGTTEELRARLQPTSGEAGTGPLLLIEMDVDGLDRGRCRITPYLQGVNGPWRPRPFRVEQVDLGQVEHVVSEMVAEAEQIWAKGNATGQAGIEFLLPAGLLNLPVQWYPASARLGLVQPICVRYPVAVRSLDRMRHQRDVLREWSTRWTKLDQQPFDGRVQWGIAYQPETVTVDGWGADLSGNDDFVVVVLSEPPTTELGYGELYRALAAGIPIILWDQRLHRPTEVAVDGMRRLTAEPARLPVEIRAVRVAAERMALVEPEHQGRSIALLWDDPNRVLHTTKDGP